MLYRIVCTEENAARHSEYVYLQHPEGANVFERIHASHEGVHHNHRLRHQVGGGRAKKAVYGHTPQSNPLPITRRRLRGVASLSTWLARAISTVKESCWQLWA
jgi:hypothetical protein